MDKFSTTATVNGQKVELKYKPSRVQSALLKSPLVKAALLAKGSVIQSRAQNMFGAKSYGLKVKVGQTRARAIVYTADMHAMLSNAKHNTLKKALGGGA